MDISVCATVGAISHWVAPLRVDVPRTDSCADLRAAIERAGRKERQAFWLQHVGGLLVNVAGGIILSELHTWREGALSFAQSRYAVIVSTAERRRAVGRDPATLAALDDVSIVAAGTVRTPALQEPK